jgi:ketosteroid isomerase-like protein
MTATTTQQTRQLIERFVQAHERADVQAIRELLTDDATWQLPPSAGVGPSTGPDRVAAALAGGAADNRDGRIAGVRNYTDTLLADRR